MSGHWQPQYEFVLSPLKLDGMEILKAQLRDAHDDIQSLKESKRQCVYLSLGSDVAAGNQGLVPWNSPLHSGRSAQSVNSHFEISDDFKTIIFRVGGVYHINCRLAQQNQGNAQFLSILVDGQAVAQSPQADGHSYLNTAQITEILRIGAGSALSVRYGADSGTSAEALMNRLTVLLLHPI